MIVMPASIHARPTRPDGERSTTGANWREAAVPEWAGELLKHNGLRFDAVTLLKPDIVARLLAVVSRGLGEAVDPPPPRQAPELVLAGVLEFEI